MYRETVAATLAVAIPAAAAVAVAGTVTVARDQRHPPQLSPLLPPRILHHATAPPLRTPPKLQRSRGAPPRTAKHGSVRQLSDGEPRAPTDERMWVRSRTQSQPRRQSRPQSQPRTQTRAASADCSCYRARSCPGSRPPPSPGPARAPAHRPLPAHPPATATARKSRPVHSDGR